MKGGFLFDEHLPKWWRHVITQLNPGILVRYLGEPGTPSLQTPDEQILEWCEAFDAILVTNNRNTMPTHLLDHLAAGRHVPGSS
jgi:Domain of unknown function (DUF5615)